MQLIYPRLISILVDVLVQLVVGEDWNQEVGTSQNICKKWMWLSQLMLYVDKCFQLIYHGTRKLIQCFVLEELTKMPAKGIPAVLWYVPMTRTTNISLELY